MSAPRLDALLKVGQVAPQAVRVQALVDTGASHTCVDPEVLTTLGLTPTGSCPVFTPSTGATPHSASVYDVSLLIPPASKGESPFIIPVLPVMASDLKIQGYHALIGRDILQACLLTYNGATGHFTLAF